MSLSGIIGADASELPICLTEVWDEGLPLDDVEKRECIRLFCLLMRDRGLTEDGAKIAICEWSGNPALAESECSGAYASSEKLTCKLLQNVRYIAERCEKSYCEFSAWRSKHNTARLDAIKKQRIDQKFKKEAEIPTSSEVSDEFREKAIDIMKHGDPVRFILDALANYHAGDRRSAELLLCSVAIGSILNANGTQPKLSGGSGKGKTHLCKALRHLMPSEWVLFTSLSPKAIYYDPDIRQGMVIFSDDVRIGEDLEDTLKRAMSNFQEPSPYRVVSKDRSLETRYLPERLIWWLTSVEDDQEEQLVNRFFSVGIDESPAQDLAALRLTFAPLAEGRQEFPTTPSVLVCREIVREIKNKIWMVRAPFLMGSDGDLNIRWQNAEDRRNPGRFVDLLAAYAVLRSGQRETEESEGYTIVTATKDDFEAAKSLYESRAENLSTKLTDRELHFIRWLREKAKNDPYAFKINDIAKSYHGADGKGLSPKTLERMLLGRPDRNSYGLIDKIRSGGLIVEMRSDTESVGDGSSKRQNRYKLFTFDPDKFNLLDSYSSVVSLKNDNKRLDPDGPGQDPKDGSDGADPLDIDIDDMIDGEDPKDPRYTEKARDGNNSLSLKVGYSGYSGSFGEPDSGPAWVRSGSDGGSFGSDGEGPRISKRDMSTPERRELTPATPADESLDSEKAKSQPPQIDRLIVVRFLQDTPSFVGIDERTYGPFQAEDIASIPDLQAKGLIEKGVAVEIRVGGKQ
jgi:hypothetical protein